MTAPRSAEQRKRDTLARLESEVNAWVATADDVGDAYLLPLSFLWDGTGLVVATPRGNLTGRNLSRGSRVRVGVGQLADVTMVDGTAEAMGDERVKDAFAAKHGWDPRAMGNDFVFFRIVPDRVQTWHERHEHPGRTLMRDGNWLV
jgi:hypothetical protein